MKLRFFSTLCALAGVLAAIAALPPAQSIARKSIGHATYTQHQSLVGSPKGTNTAHTRRSKQTSTTVEPLSGVRNPSSGFPSFPDSPSFPSSPNNGGGITVEPVGGATATNILTLHHTRQNATTGHTDQSAKYKTWGGSNWEARINPAGEFIHTQQNAQTSLTDIIINYISWDGQAWTATINPATKVFTHTQRSTGASHTDSILNYVTWDGAQWTMRLQ